MPLTRPKKKRTPKERKAVRKRVAKNLRTREKAEREIWSEELWEYWESIPFHERLAMMGVPI